MRDVMTLASQTSVSASSLLSTRAWRGSLISPCECSAENARLFKDDLLKRNVKNSNVLALHSLRLGINSIIALSNSIKDRRVDKLGLADNPITDYGVHAVKKIINDTKLSSVNLASCMISGEGLELFLDDLIKNTTLKQLDLGVVETSMRKNSLGI